MARPLAPRCGTIDGHLDAIAMVLARMHGCFTCRGRRQVILNYNPGPSRMLQYRVASSTRWTLSSLTGSFAGLQWCGRSSSSFIIKSSGLWKHELWPWVIWDIYEWHLLFHGGAVLRGMGTFWKRSVSCVLLGVRWFLGFRWCLC